MTITVEEHLAAFVEYGEEHWRGEVQRLVLDALRTGSAKHEAFWRNFTKDFDWLDWDLLKQQAQPTAPRTEQLVAEAFKSQMPGIKSQAQYDAAVGALEATRLVINSLLNVDRRAELDAQRALELAFDAVRKATELTLKLEESPEAATSAAARQFKDAPAQFEEGEILTLLTLELQLIRSVGALNDWYASTKARRDKIVTQSMRNELLDAIRAKRNALAGG